MFVLVVADNCWLVAKKHLYSRWFGIKNKTNGDVFFYFVWEQQQISDHKLKWICFASYIHRFVGKQMMSLKWLCILLYIICRLYKNQIIIEHIYTFIIMCSISMSITILTQTGNKFIWCLLSFANHSSNNNKNIKINAALLDGFSSIGFCTCSKVFPCYQ